MAETNSEHLEAYNKAHERVEAFQGTRNTIATSKVESDKKSVAEHGERLRKIQAMLESMKAKEDEAIAAAKKFANQENPNNTQMYLDAYTEYFDYLSQQDSVSDEQVNSLVDNIDGLEKLLASEKLRQQVENNEVPDEVSQQVSGEELEQVRGLLLEVVTQRIADLKGQIPPGEFEGDKIKQLWLQALAKYKDIQRSEAEQKSSSHEGVPPLDKYFPATRPVAVNPGWTGFYKKREARRGVRASRGIRSEK